MGLRRDLPARRSPVSPGCHARCQWPAGYTAAVAQAAAMGPRRPVVPLGSPLDPHPGWARPEAAGLRGLSSPREDPQHRSTSSLSTTTRRPPARRMVTLSRAVW